MNALFRCDATADIGFGHLSRCIALAEAFRLSDVRSTFAGAFDAAAGDQIAAAGFDRLDLPGPVNSEASERHLAGLTAREGPGFVVVDSYRADERYLAGLKALGRFTVLMDDFAALDAYPCDVILNFTWEAASLGYPKGPRLLLGPGYFPARRALVALRPDSLARDRSGAVRNLLVAIGGADPKGLAPRLVRLLHRDHETICLYVIAAHAADSADMVARFAPGSTVLSRQPDLSQPLLWADAAITGGGLIKYECAFLGVPAAALSQNAGQAGESRALTRAGLVFDLGLAEDRSDQQLAGALGDFLSDPALRDGLTARMRKTFPADPSAKAAHAILEAIGR